MLIEKKRILLAGALFALIAIAAALPYALTIKRVYFTKKWNGVAQEDVVVRTTKLRDNIYLLQGDGGNVTVLIGDDGVLIVDTDEKWMAPKIEAAIAQLTDQPVKYVVNTHFHGDHRGGNGYFRARGAEIIAHRAVHATMQFDTWAPATEEDLPTILFDDEYRLSFAGEEIRIFHIPLAHTNGDALIHFEKANVLAAGDIFVFEGLPYISVGTGATIDGFIAAEPQWVANLTDDTLIVPGHGGIAKKSNVIATYAALREVRADIASIKRRGVNQRWTPVMHPLRRWPDEWISDDYGAHPKDFTRIVHRTVPE